MKKGIIVLLITVLAAGMVFADFSGDAYIQFNANLDKKNFGFVNGTDFGFSFKIDSEVANVGGENPIHAELEATANLIVAEDGNGSQDALSIWSNQDSSTEVDGATLVYTPADPEDASSKATGAVGVGKVTEYTHPYGFGLILKVKTAKIVGENWSIAINGASSSYDYAKASSYYVRDKQVYDDFGNKYYKTWQPASYSVSYKKAPGITATYDGFTVSFGFNKADDKTAYSATLATKQFAFAEDMIKIQVAAEASKAADKEVTNVGASAKAAFAKDKISANVAADFGFEGIGGDDEVKVQFDASLAAAYDFISATAYVFKGTKLEGTYKDLYLEATLAADLNAFDVPVSVSFAAENIVDKNDAGIALSASAAYSKDAITVGADFSIGLKDKAWDVNGYGIYAAEKFTAGANVYYSSEAKSVSCGAFAESSALIEGVKLGLNYGLAESYFRNYGGAYCVSNGVNVNSFNSDAKVLGTATAYCLIGF